MSRSFLPLKGTAIGRALDTLNNADLLKPDYLGADSAFVSDRALSNLHDKPVTKAFVFIVSGICLNSMMRAVHWA